MPKDPPFDSSQADFARLLIGRAQSLLERMASEIEWDEGNSALGRLLANAIAAGDGVEAEAIHTAMHWAPAVVEGNITEAELVRRLYGIISPELMAAAVANYREILSNVVRRWARALAEGYATETAVVEELGIPAEIVRAIVAECKRASAQVTLGNAAKRVEEAARTFRAAVTRK